MSLTLGPTFSGGETLLGWVQKGGSASGRVRTAVLGSGGAGMSWLVGWVQPPIGRGIACAVWAMTPVSPGISMSLITKVVPLLSCLTTR